MKRIILSLSCLACISLFAQAGELYRWVDDSGKVYYGDVPPADQIEIEVRNFPAGVTPSEYLPYETRIAQQHFPVVLYVVPSCEELCIQARNLLSERGIPFSEKILRTKDEVDAFKQVASSEVVPTLVVGKTILKGFLAGKWNGELDIAGYPERAPYRASTHQPVVPTASNPSDTETLLLP
ncbi:MAG: glutaredoxin family protein [Gallionella sp.]